MFSMNGVSSQVFGSLSEVSNHLFQIKSSLWAGCVTYSKYFKKKKSNVKFASQLEDAKVNSVPCTEGPFDLFCNLPENWTKICSPLAIKPWGETPTCSPWKVSHLSRSTFFENKHGFSGFFMRHHFNNPTVQLRWHTKFQGNSICLLHTERQIKELEDQANHDTSNANLQAQYLRSIVNEDPHYVIRRYESEKYASNDACYREYLKALVLTDRVSDTEVGQATGKWGFPARTIHQTQQDLARDMGSEGNPLVVTVNNDKRSFFKEQLWNTLRFLIGLFLIVSVLEAQLQMRMTSNQKEVQPDSSEKKVKFSDVQGVEEAKSELKEVVEFLRSPEKFTRLGGKLPSGILLVGAPGTGKTLLAKAVAGEAGVPFFFSSGAEFDEMFVGVGAARVRNLFAAAKEIAPCIIFIDELDAIGGTRSVGDHQPYSRMTLNQLLVELDGFDKTEGIVVIGATNFPEILDKALVRPGRFDSRVTVPMPDVRARTSIIGLHIKNIELDENVSIDILARGTPGFSGADLANLVNQAALKAASDGHGKVTNEHLDYARDKIIMGPERKSAFIEQKNKEVVAYHEGGHALVAYHTPEALPLHKATIVPRGDALGMVAQLPEKDELSWTKKQLLAKMDVCMGGRAAEEIIFGKDNITSGASSDFLQATNIARAMVTKYCMSEKIGSIVVKDDDKISPDLQNAIESEIKDMIHESYQRAKAILQTYSTQHRRLAEALLKYESLNADELPLVIQGKSID